MTVASLMLRRSSPGALVSVAIAMPRLWPWPATRGLTPFGSLRRPTA